jgi:crossover junction endodeoxyribonuclease RuvC
MSNKYPPTSICLTITRTKNNFMRILGIDPGFAQTGWAVVDVFGQRYRPVSFGVVKTTTQDGQAERIHEIATEIGRIASSFNVERVGMEDIYFAKNVSSAITVAKVIGAITHQLLSQELPVRLFSPPQIKTTVTGYGNSEKNQVQEMMRLMLGMESIPKPDHAADALAAAICLATFSATEVRILK